MTHLKTTNHPVIHLDVTQRHDLVLLPTESRAKDDWKSADSGNATELPRNDDARHNHSTRHSSKSTRPTGTSRNWLQGDPFAWRGRKIRHRKTRVIYTVRQVFKSGRVELQKGFMSYLMHARTIQKDYETHS